MPKTAATKRSRKLPLQKASASEIISALGIRPAEERRASAAVASAERMIRRAGSEKKRLSGRVVRVRK